MKKIALFLIAVCGCLISMSGAPKQKVVKVKSATELVKAIASNTKIVITTTKLLNITEAVDQLIATGEIAAVDWDAPELEFGVYFDSMYDGPELIVAGMINLTIEGPAPDETANLQVKPRYSNVFRFENCENLELTNLNMGHIEGATCSSGVVTINDCRGVTMRNTILYGCGEVGLYLNNTSDFAMNNSTIHKCSERAMMIDAYNGNSTGPVFNNCGFVNCANGIMVGEGTTGTIFNNCTFTDNKGTLFWLESPIVLNNCEVEHHTNDEDGNPLITRNGGTWETDFRDATELPDIEPDDEELPYGVTKRYAWEGYLNGDVHFRLEAEQGPGDQLIGEMTYFRKNGKVADIPVYGKFQEIGDGEWLMLSEYDKGQECGTIMIDLGPHDTVYNGKWGYGNKEMKMTDTKKVEFSEGKHLSFFQPVYGSDIDGEFGFTYVKSEEADLKGGGYAKLTTSSDGARVSWQISQNSGGIAEASGISDLSGNHFAGSFQNYEFIAYIYKDCLFVERTNPDDGRVEDWGVAGGLEGTYLRK